MGVILIGGGARSGKSRFALDYAGARFARRAFIAAARAGDEEMSLRIARHQSERGPEWTTIEEPFDIAGAVARHREDFDVFVVDCLTIWLSNVLLDPERDARAEMEALVRFIDSHAGPELVLVANEVGCGIVPDTPLGREFRDLAGEFNQSIARVADEVYWTVFGLPVRVKPNGLSASER